MLRSTFYLLLLSASLYSCCDCPEEPAQLAEMPVSSMDSLQGSFIRTADNDRAGQKDSLFPITGITIKGGHAQFIYDGTPMSGTCEVDNGFVYINTASELGILGLEIMDKDRLEGEGFAHGSFARSGGTVMATVKDDAVDPEPTTQDNTPTPTSQPSNSTTPTKTTTSSSGSGNTTGSSSNAQQVSDPFGSGGGTASGQGGVNSPVGVDTGEDSPIRTRLSDVDVSKIKSASDETVTLQIAIDGAGNVVKASAIKNKTTTDDQALIDQVITAVKKEVKYSRNTGAALKYEIYTVRVRKN